MDPIQAYKQANPAFLRQCQYEENNSSRMETMGNGLPPNGAAGERRAEFKRLFEANGMGTEGARLMIYPTTLNYAADTNDRSLITARNQFDQQCFSFHHAGSDSDDDISEDEGLPDLFPVNEDSLINLVENLDAVEGVDDPSYVEQPQIAYHPAHGYRLMKRIVKYGNCEQCFSILPRGMQCHFCNHTTRSVSFRFQAENNDDGQRPFISPFLLYDIVRGPYRSKVDYFLDHRYFCNRSDKYDPNSPALNKSLKMEELFDVMRHNEAYMLIHDALEASLARHFHSNLAEIRESIDAMENGEGYPFHIRDRMLFARRVHDEDPTLRNSKYAQTGAVPPVHLDDRWLARTLAEQARRQRDYHDNPEVNAAVDDDSDDAW